MIILRRLFPVLCIALTGFCANLAFAVSEEEKTIPLVWEARGYSDSVFRDVRGAAVDDARGWIGVLEGSPQRIVYFRSRNGGPAKQIVIRAGKTPVMGHTVSFCRKTILVVEPAALYALKEDGTVVSQRRLVFPFSSDEITWYVKKTFCDAKDRMWMLLTDQPNGLFLADAKGAAAAVAMKDKKPQTRDAAVGSVDDIAMERNGNVLVADAGAGNVKRYDTNGKFIGVAVRQDTTSQYGLAQPKLLAVDSRGNIWVYDDADRRLKVYDPIGFYKYWVSDTSPEGFRYVQPVWMAIDRSDRLLLLDRATRTLRAFDAKETQ